jgi:hypothetical protein
MRARTGDRAHIVAIFHPSISCLMRCVRRRHQLTRHRKIEDYSDSPGGATSNADVPSRSTAFSTKPDLLASSTNSFV